ncbi:hypothetical protein DRQ33_02185 [bacterium]|nr:MAG: hypothetical protein DRQ33_02185 [bacterium]
MRKGLTKDTSSDINLRDDVNEQLQKLEEEVRRYRKLLEVSASFQSEMDIDQLLPLIIKRATESVKAEKCMVYIYNPDKGVLWTKLKGNAHTVMIPHNQGIIGWVFNNNKPYIVADVYSDSHFDPSVDAKVDFKAKAVAVFPLCNRRGKPIAVFEAINRVGGGEFQSEEVKFLMMVAHQIGIAIENALLYTELLSTFESFIDVMAFTIDAKHPISRGHSRRVALYAKGIAREFGLSDDTVEKIHWAGLLHDYGKISVPDSILQKAGKLDDEEYEQIKRHALMTYRILSRIHFSRYMRDIPLIASEHHERWDGKGYPFGKKDEQIPLGARIIAIADVFDALTSFREYHSPMTFAEAREEILSERGKMFDPRVVDAFIRYYDKELDPYKLRQTLWKSMGK